MVQALRRVGIAIGSLTIAWLALALVGGAFGLTPSAGVSGLVAVIVLGGLIYLDIRNRERRRD